MFAVRAGLPDAHDDWWYSPTPYSLGGIRVTPDTANALTAVYACRKVIYESVMQLPLILYRREFDRATGRTFRERATDHPLYPLLHDAPNEDWTAAEWRELQQDFLLARGNGFSQLVVDSRRQVREIGPPIHPDTVTIRETVGGRYAYDVRPTDGTAAYTVPKEEMLHLRAMVTNRRLGMNPIEVERAAIGLGLIAQNFQSRFLKNDATPPGWIEHPAHFANDEDRKQFRRDYQASQTGENRGKTPVLEWGMKYHAITVKLRDMEFLATRKYQNLDVARIFRVPPHLIMDLDRATFSNISAQGIEFVKYTLLPWLRRWEQRLAFDLMPGPGYYFEFLVDGLERGDPAMRAAYYASGVQNGWLARNEARSRENLDEREGLDEFLEPRNMAEAGTQPDAERFEAMRQNAARATAVKLRRHAEKDPAGLAGCVDDVARIMAVSQDQAFAMVDDLAATLFATGDLDEFEREAARRLTEI